MRLLGGTGGFVVCQSSDDDADADVDVDVCVCVGYSSDAASTPAHAQLCLGQKIVGPPVLVSVGVQTFACAVEKKRPTRQKERERGSEGTKERQRASENRKETVK